MYSKNKIYLLTLLSIVISEDTLLFGTNSNQNFIILRFVLYIIFLFFIINGVWRSINKTSFYFTIIITMCIIFTMLLHNEFRNGYILQLLGIYVALKFTSYLDLKTFLKSFSSVVYLLSIVSVIFFVIVNLSTSILKTLPVITNIADVDFATIYISNIIKSDGLLRNSSIFREPGVFSMYSIISLMYELLLVNKRNIKRIIIISLALFTTFSTAGYIVLVVVVIAHVLNVKGLKSKVSFILIAVSIVAILLPIVLFDVFSKLNPDSSSYVSTLSRTSSFVVPTKIFIENPLGVGLTKLSDLYAFHSYNLFGKELDSSSVATNTLLNTFAIYGFIYGIILVLATFRLVKQFKLSRLVSVFVLLAFLLLFSSQELRFSLLFNCLIMYGLSFKNVAKGNYYQTFYMD